MPPTQSQVCPTFCQDVTITRTTQFDVPFNIPSLPDFLPRCHGGRVLGWAYTARTETWSRCAPSTRTVRPVRTAVCECVAVVCRRTEQLGAFGLRRAAVGGIGMSNFLAAPCHTLHSKSRLTTPTGRASCRGPAAWYGATSRWGPSAALIILDAARPAVARQAQDGRCGRRCFKRRGQGQVHHGLMPCVFYMCMMPAVFTLPRPWGCCAAFVCNSQKIH